ncbi:MAG: hypothetical protein IPH94_16620 [Saprospiraceae bacterium]|nr:hypothetical protein [Saprospiraceae bacterium]
MSEERDEKLNENLLENWFQKHLKYSSFLFTYDNRTYCNRFEVDLVHNVFKDFFSINYFLQQDNQKRISSEKINYISSALSEESESSYRFHVDIAKQLHYSKSLPEDVYAKYLKSSTNNINQLLDKLFEIYIYKLFSEKGIIFKPQVIKQGALKNPQSIEGIIDIMGCNFEFECNRPRNPSFKNLIIHINLINEFKSLSLKKHHFHSAKGYIIIHEYNNNIVDQIIKGLKKTITDQNNHTHITEYFEIILTEYRGSKYNSVIKKNKSKFYIDFNFSTPKGSVETLLTTNTNIILENLFTNLNKKRKQHNEREKIPRLYFFDNLSVKNIHLPFFPNGINQDFNNEIRTYMSSKRIIDIICIVDRKYDNNISKAIFNFFYSIYQEPFVNFVQDKLENKK